MVMAFNDAGQMLLPAFVTSRIVPGTVYVWDGPWYNPNAKGLDLGGAQNTISINGFQAHAQDPHNDLVEVQLA
jgi:anaerobic dimethyl sulfoxide reductase subunit A